MTNPGANREAELNKLKAYIVNFISHELENQPPIAGDRRKVVNDLMQQAYASTRLALPTTLRDQLFHDILDDILGFGSLQPLLDDPEITEVMVNGAKKIYIERKGILTKTNITLENDDQVLHLIEKIILPLGRRIDGDSPTVDARLPDGSRVNAVIPPVAIDGPTITIRKFDKGKLNIDQLIQFGSISQGMADFIKACVLARLNIVISGGTGSGKTTLLNVLSGFIPENDHEEN